MPPPIICMTHNLGQQLCDRGPFFIVSILGIADMSDAIVSQHLVLEAPDPVLAKNAVAERT